MASQLYRQFIKLGTTAVENELPQKYILRKLLRARFDSPVSPSSKQIENTLQFFRAAATSNGLERRCIHTIIHVEASRYHRSRVYVTGKLKANQAHMAFNDEFYDTIINKINETQEMCL